MASSFNLCSECTQKMHRVSFCADLSPNELLTSHIAKDLLLGEGSFGRVFRVFDKTKAKFVAMKVIRLDLEKTEPEQLEKEVLILKNLDHPSIVKYLCSERQLASVNIYMEYMPGGSVSGLLKQYGPFTENLTAKFTKQILQGLHYLHTQKVVHRDLKCANILVASNGTVKIADFGASRLVENFALIPSNSELCDSVKGSVYWMAPEVLKGESYGRKVDIWSLGCVVLEMVTAKHPWLGLSTYRELCLAIVEQKLPKIPSGLSGKCRNFLESCFVYDRKYRPGAQTLLKHPFIST